MLNTTRGTVKRNPFEKTKKNFYGLFSDLIFFSKKGSYTVRKKVRYFFTLSNSDKCQIVFQPFISFQIKSEHFPITSSLHPAITHIYVTPIF